MMPAQQSTLSDVYDVVIVGGGVVGCAIARRMTLEGWRVVLTEKAPDILDGASKGNSAILHTGFDAPPGSLEARCIAEGYDEFRSIQERLGLPLVETGALVLAWTEQELARLDGLIEQAHANGVDDVARLDAHQARNMEPELSEGVMGGFRVPGEHLIDPWSTPYAYLLQAVENGATVLRQCRVSDGEFDGARWQLETSQGCLHARLVINAAGLYGDRLDETLIGHSDFTIRPRKGQFIVFDKPAARLTRHILLPVPTEKTKGIVVCRTVFGNVLVGPTAEEQEDRSFATVDAQALQDLRQAGERILPALAGEDVTAFYAGLRPATEHKDYQVRTDKMRNYVTVGGIRSTGLSAALGLARHVHQLCEQIVGPSEPMADPAWPKVGNISEYAPRDWQAPGNEGIVCHCELVTRREIEKALDGPLGARSLAGLKRRTRVTMGRCQGFYCTAQLAAMTAGRFAEPIATGESPPPSMPSHMRDATDLTDVR
ncbi:NAD(P)/FAD-dependent oxidoreductase [Hoeflea prorocentri]|uniref:NAD(P)/FAD-dependent oxidoreductase n=1 Tax=Hoeflea prorocentri TaxID=1922333 RepID=A0A9X3UJT5_9HYPH|nr:NAD(P)/FAD-dependent oxidoreductase [Hoeflea prorocentri]MCY6381922.1 NAD(P)/FAD-dependent oxidoreductase [Hoeflea prorocentri]MDA5399722.1 NAD(P)/FAD-dependent oxidoreductase [Hoeflea prorocentri]